MISWTSAFLDMSIFYFVFTPVIVNLWHLDLFFAKLSDAILTIDLTCIGDSDGLKANTIHTKTP